MVETDIQHRCFYVEEELLSIPSYPKERQREELKRKKSRSPNSTSSKKLDSGIDKVRLSYLKAYRLYNINYIHIHYI